VGGTGNDFRLTSFSDLFFYVMRKMASLTKGHLLGIFILSASNLSILLKFFVFLANIFRICAIFFVL